MKVSKNKKKQIETIERSSWEHITKRIVAIAKETCREQEKKH